MNALKQKKSLEYFYYAISVLFTGVFIFEVPSAVFWSPVFLFIAFLVYSVYNKRKLASSFSLFVLIIFALTYVFFIYVPGTSLYYQSYIYIHAFIMYAIGLNFANDKTIEERKKLIEYFFLTIAVFYVVYVGLTFWNYFYNSPADLRFRYYYSIWYRTVTKPATVISMCFVFALAYGTYALFYLKLPKKIIGALLIALTIYVNLRTGTRTLVYVFPILIAAEFIFWLIFEKKKPTAGIITTVFCIAAFFAGLFLILKYKNLLAEKFGDYGFARFFKSDRSTQLRILYSKNVLDNFKFTYFGGAINTLTCGAPHNIWLHIYDWGGIIPFVIFCIFTIIMIYNYIRFFFSRKYTVSLKALLSTVLFLIFVEFMMEPFILPLPSLYILCFFVFGLITGLSSKAVKEAKADKKAVQQ